MRCRGHADEASKLVDYLDGYIAKQGYAPTLEEIGGHFGLSSLRRSKHHQPREERASSAASGIAVARSRVVKERRVAAVELPLLGRVAAGAPIEALEAPIYDRRPGGSWSAAETFVLRVRGQSMVKEGILDGEAHRRRVARQADNGDTVVALIRGDATVKRFYREKAGMVRLQPANDSMAPIIARAADVEIRGIVVAVMRKYLPGRKRPT